MSILWSKKRPGELPQMEDGGFVIGTANWVRLPPQLGGDVVKVMSRSMQQCACSGGHESVSLMLDAKASGKTIHVDECTVKGFLWYTRSSE